ncbi:sensor histidine kinase [Micromonospora yangpuensis]|uniref:histidine kinase n=1 Tax=Micromonospora yangpuensis TaxID=683228 RepID=A0A1C6U859_9ACTN|nr:histidine kinase [Micromonospora yangpuensis]GGL89461.1 two-component sensor histidine kinase [Micromonospora yangpuensis]SCL50270.1 Signal transduction histidine kinase [Micromonospora yangpuensis]
MTSAVVPDHPWLLPGALTTGGQPARRPRRTTRDWLVDGTFFLLALAFLVAAHYDARQAQPEFALNAGPSWLVGVDILAGLLAVAALWVRRRWPVALALVLLPVGLFSVTAGVALLVVLFTVVVHRAFPVAAAVVGLHLLAVPVSLRLRPDPVLSDLAAVILVGSLIAATVAWGMFVRARRQLILSLRDRAERAEAEQQLRVTQARQVERTRIAREMHDVLAHRISLLSLHAGALEFRPDAPPPEIARAAGVIRASAHTALEDLRAVIGVLRADTAASDAPEPPQPTLADVPALVGEARAAGMRVELTDGVREPTAVPAALGRTGYRIVQEGLTNARKHAPGVVATVALTGGPADGLTIEIRNRWPVGGPVAPEIPGTGTGLVGIAERVSLAGGRLTHGRDDTGDFHLTAWLPWPT